MTGFVFKILHVLAGISTSFIFYCQIIFHFKDIPHFMTIITQGI